MFSLTKLHCSFCGKSETEVAKLVAGPRVYICDSCVAIASRIISDSEGPNPPERVEIESAEGAQYDSQGQARSASPLVTGWEF